MGIIYMGNSINNDTSVCKELGKFTLAAGAGLGTYAVASLPAYKVSNSICNNLASEAQKNNSIFKNFAQKALKNENILCTTVDKAFKDFLSALKEDDNELFMEKTKAFRTYISEPNDPASKINYKIDNFFAKLVSKLKINNSKPNLAEQTRVGLNAMSKKDIVFADLNKMSMAVFHEMGHVKNYQSKRVGKVLNILSHPLLKKISIGTALVGIMIPPDKEENNTQEKESILSKTGDVIRDNCVTISALGTVPKALEEGLASIKGAKIASKVMPSGKLKMINKLNGKAFLTYAIGAALLPLGIYIAKKTREALA